MAGVKTEPLNREQLQHLVAWRAEALEKMPYMASVLMNFRPLNAPGLGTFACDRYLRLYIDFDAVVAWGAPLCSEALLHECLHIFQHDAERADEYHVPPTQKALFNTASDAANNDDLAEAGCVELARIGVTPKTIGAPAFQTSEYYYEHLLRQQPPPSEASSGQGEPYSGCGSGAGGESAPCELDPEDDANGHAPAAGDLERRVIDVTVAADVCDHAARHPGSTPGGLVTRAQAMLQPSRVPWRTTLASSIRRATASRLGDTDVTYSRRNRRQPNIPFGGGRVIQPGIETPIPRIAVVRDTSGSMSIDDLATASSEIEGVARQIGVRDDNLVVIDVDTKAASARRYHQARDIEDAHGGGGTDMAAGIEAALHLRPRPSAIVVITDGYTPWPETPVGVRVVACLVGNPPRPVVDSVPAWMTRVVVDG